MNHGSLIRLAITPGEPAGIGPDLCVMLAQQVQDAEWIVIADPQLLTERAQHLGLPLNILPFSPDTPPAITPAGSVKVLPVSLATPVNCGTLNRRNAEYVLQCLRQAVEGCQNGTFDALVTGPIHKGIINEAGIPFTGHTEFLAKMTGGIPVMMLATEGLRVALVTTHLPLRAIADAITPARVEQIIRILHADLQARFGLDRPRILVCGLNPHAGEGGHMGREEIDIIEPVLARLCNEGMDLTGPLPADTLFTPSHLEQADAVLAMYHDQGLPVLKHLGFGKAVNITLGLPIIRTSVDHGTALDLAGSGNAQIGSLETAIHTAITMARHGNPQT